MIQLAATAPALSGFFKDRFDLVVGECWHYGRHHDPHGTPCLCKASNRLESTLRRRCSRLHLASQSRIQGSHAYARPSQAEATHLAKDVHVSFD